MYQIHHTRVSRQHCVIASIAALVYFIRKTFSKYNIHTKSNVKSPSDDRLAADTSAVNKVQSTGSAAIVYAADDSLTTTAHDKLKKGRPRAFNGNPMTMPSTMVVVDMENDDLDKYTNHKVSPPPRRRRPEETLQDSLCFVTN